MTKSSFDGNISEIPFISVDNFTKLNRRAYFLSHCHTDHTEGLYSEEFLKYLSDNEDIFIYMSKPSAVIVSCETNNSKLMKYIKPLRIEKTLISIPGDNKNNIPEQLINVTLIPAGHCFGSVMFLYRTQHKTVLYTGDFRISMNSLSNYSQFIENGQVISLDTLYVDTTFQNHENFPKRSESIGYVVEEIQRFLDQGGFIALHTSAKYGYEAVCKEIYKKLGVKVYVNDYKWKLYSQYPDLGLTNSPNETQIHICSNRNDHMKSHERCLPNQNDGPYLYIHFSALKWTNYQLNDLMIDKFPNRIDVCFPTHCSRSELLYFISYFNVGKIVGFPEPLWSEYGGVRSKREECCIRNKVPKIVDYPEPLPSEDFGVKRKRDENKVPKKVDKDLLKEMFD